MKALFKAATIASTFGLLGAGSEYGLSVLNASSSTIKNVPTTAAAPLSATAAKVADYEKLFGSKGGAIHSTTGKGSVLYYNHPETIHPGMGARNMPTASLTEAQGRVSMMFHHQNLSGKSLKYTVKFSSPVEMQYGYGITHPAQAGQAAAKQMFSSTPKTVSELSFDIPHGKTLSFAGYTSKPINTKVSAGFDINNPSNLYPDAQATISENSGVKSFDVSPTKSKIFTDYGPSEKVLGYGHGQKNVQGVKFGEVAGGYAGQTEFNLTNPTSSPVKYNINASARGATYGAPFVYNVDGKNITDEAFSVTVNPNETKVVKTFTHGGVDTDRVIAIGTDGTSELKSGINSFVKQIGAQTDGLQSVLFARRALREETGKFYYPKSPIYKPKPSLVKMAPSFGLTDALEGFGKGVGVGFGGTLFGILGKRRRKKKLVTGEVESAVEDLPPLSPPKPANEIIPETEANNIVQSEQPVSVRRESKIRDVEAIQRRQAEIDARRQTAEMVRQRREQARAARNTFRGSAEDLPLPTQEERFLRFEDHFSRKRRRQQHQERMAAQEEQSLLRKEQQKLFKERQRNNIVNQQMSAQDEVRQRRAESRMTSPQDTLEERLERFKATKKYRNSSLGRAYTTRQNLGATGVPTSTPSFVFNPLDAPPTANPIIPLEDIIDKTNTQRDIFTFSREKLQYDFTLPSKSDLPFTFKTQPEPSFKLNTPEMYEKELVGDINLPKSFVFKTEKAVNNAPEFSNPKLPFNFTNDASKPTASLFENYNKPVVRFNPVDNTIQDLPPIEPPTPANPVINEAQEIIQAQQPKQVSREVVKGEARLNRKQRRALEGQKRRALQEANSEKVKSARANRNSVIFDAKQHAIDKRNALREALRKRKRTAILPSTPSTPSASSPLATPPKKAIEAVHQEAQTISEQGTLASQQAKQSFGNADNIADKTIPGEEKAAANAQKEAVQEVVEKVKRVNAAQQAVETASNPNAKVAVEALKNSIEDLTRAKNTALSHAGILGLGASTLFALYAIDRNDKKERNAPRRRNGRVHANPRGYDSGLKAGVNGSAALGAVLGVGLLTSKNNLQPGAKAFLAIGSAVLGGIGASAANKNIDRKSAILGMAGAGAAATLMYALVSKNGLSGIKSLKSFLARQGPSSTVNAAEAAGAHARNKFPGLQKLLSNEGLGIGAGLVTLPAAHSIMVKHFANERRNQTDHGDVAFMPAWQDNKAGHTGFRRSNAPLLAMNNANAASVNFSGRVETHYNSASIFERF